MLTLIVRRAKLFCVCKPVYPIVDSLFLSLSRSSNPHTLYLTGKNLLFLSLLLCVFSLFKPSAAVYIIPGDYVTEQINAIVTFWKMLSEHNVCNAVS